MSTPEQRSLDERWEAFQQLDRLKNHWYWRPGWREGRSFYTWHLTFEGAHELHALTESLYPALDVKGLDPVPIDGLHLTMQGLGFTDEISDDQVRSAANGVREACRGVEPFDLELGPVDPDEEGVGLLVRPWAPVIALRSAIRDGIRAAWGRVPEPAEGFRPHVTAAYSSDAIAAEPVRLRLTPLRDIPAAVVHVAATQLIRLSRDEEFYRWNVEATIGLPATEG